MGHLLMDAIKPLGEAVGDATGDFGKYAMNMALSPSGLINELGLFDKPEVPMDVASQGSAWPGLGAGIGGLIGSIWGPAGHLIGNNLGQNIGGVIGAGGGLSEMLYNFFGASHPTNELFGWY